MNLRSLLALVPVERLRNPPPVVAVLRFAGVIGNLGPLRRGLSLASAADQIETAFKMRRLHAVALAINSPGGSPVQAALIARRIRALAEEKNIPVFAFAEDVAASGGYWLACAGDEIYAQESSIVGSIGVVTQGFGFAGLMKRLGIERRLHTAGESKAILDPFLTEKPEDVERLKKIQEDIHGTFKDLVRERRADKLKAPEDELFSGAFWTGRKALEVGLIDGIGDMRGVLREKLGDNVKLRLVAGSRPWLRRRLGLAMPGDGTGRGLGDPGDWAAGLLAVVEERLWWGRFGL
ncbi:MAG: S49 family peptidase [Rhodospirillales bacterium]|jgi:signal peptide peptidase SppA|nr:S49 family peptidase [Rhodospirillales bacterium]HJO73231.1 S49 family peptidase [Rhodospirillales bacterium]